MVAPDLELDPFARRREADQARQAARAHDRLAVDLGDDVARLQAGVGRCAARCDVRDQRAFDMLHAERIGKRLVQVLHRHAEPAVRSLAGGDDLVLHLERNVDRDRERETLEAAAARIDLRIDADHRAAAVEQRAARVAGVDRGVGLDEGHHRVAGQRTPLGADDALRRSLLQPVGRADREHRVADLEALRVAEADHGEVFGVDAKHGDVGRGVDAEHLGREFAAVAELDGHLLGFAHDVGVGQHQAVGADDEARAHAPERRRGALPAALLKARHAAEELEERVGFHALGQAALLLGAHLVHADDGDADDGRRRLLDDGAVVRHLAGRGQQRHRRHHLLGRRELLRRSGDRGVALEPVRKVDRAGGADDRDAGAYQRRAQGFEGHVISS